MARSETGSTLEQRAHKVLRDSFSGKKSNANPRAIIMAGPQGSGKSTKAKALLRKEVNFVYINPDSTLIALNGGRRKLPDNDPDVFNSSQELTERVVQHAIANRFNVCLDTSIPAPSLLTKMKDKGYSITFVVMTTPQELARKREVHRDLTQLKWGRAGINSVAQAATATEIARSLPQTISRFADSVVTCQNAGSVMSCTDDTRIRPDAKGPNVSIRARQKRLTWLPHLA